MTHLDQVLAQARELSEEEQQRLIDGLLEGIHKLDDSIQSKWADIAEARAEEIKSGKVQTIPADEVSRELKERFPDT